jgi:hypothetical protein
MQYVDETVLDSNLTSVANSIRGRTGNSTQLVFPTDFVTSIDDLLVKSEHMQPLLNAVSYTETVKLDSVLTQEGYTALWNAQSIGNMIVRASVADYKSKANLSKVYRIDPTTKTVVEITDSSFQPLDNDYRYIVSDKKSIAYEATAIYFTQVIDDFYNALLLMFGGTV